MSYAHDPAGNRTSARQGKADRLTSVANLTAVTDADGHLTALSGPGVADTFAYDQANRLVSATVNGVATAYVNDTNLACR